MNPTVPSAAPAPRARRGMTRNQSIGLGLLFSFVGLFLLILLLPTDPAQFAHILPIAAAGILVLWVGGILLGRARGA